MTVKKQLWIAALALAAGSTWAAPVNSFGALPQATFGGTGIPNSAVAISRVGDAADPVVLLGLTAHQRYSNPALTNDGAGTFYAQPGVDTHAPSPANPYALWNLAFYIGGLDASEYTYTLFYDLDPAAGNAPGGSLDLTPLVGLSGGLYQDSWNLGMDFFTGVPAFDPASPGEYSFALVAYGAGDRVAGTSIRVSVGNVNAVPEPGTLALAGLALVGLAAARRRKA